MTFTDEQLNELGEQLSKLIEDFSKANGNAPMLLMFGAKEDDGNTVKLLAQTKNLEWEDACRIAIGCNGLVANNFGNN